MFFQNVGYRWGECRGDTVDGAVLSAASQDIEHMQRRDDRPTAKHLLFDPQLYFLDFDEELSTEEFAKTLARLVTFPWFGADTAGFESGEQALKNWRGERKDNALDEWRSKSKVDVGWPAKVAACVNLQQQAGCTAIILPSMLVTTSEGGRLQATIGRLDEAIEVAAQLSDRPLLASLPLSQAVLQHADPYDGDLAEVLAEQILTRPELAGAYVPLVSNGDRDRLSSLPVAVTILRLCRYLTTAPDTVVVPNYIESLGFAALSVGAMAYASGYARKHRRFAIQDFRDSGGGLALPKFYSHGLVADLWPERDLERLPERRCLRFVAADRTAASAALLDALRARARVSSVLEWEERRNNIQQAVRHYCERHAMAAATRPSEDSITEWLQNGERDCQYLSSRFVDDPLLLPDSRHLPVWRTAFEAVLSD